MTRLLPIARPLLFCVFTLSALGGFAFASPVSARDFVGTLTVSPIVAPTTSTPSPIIISGESSVTQYCYVGDVYCGYFPKVETAPASVDCLTTTPTVKWVGQGLSHDQYLGPYAHREPVSWREFETEGWGTPRHACLFVWVAADTYELVADVPYTVPARPLAPAAPTPSTTGQGAPSTAPMTLAEVQAQVTAGLRARYGAWVEPTYDCDATSSGLISCFATWQRGATRYSLVVNARGSSGTVTLQFGTLTKVMMLRKAVAVNRAKSYTKGKWRGAKSIRVACTRDDDFAFTCVVRFELRGKMRVRKLEVERNERRGTTSVSAYSGARSKSLSDRDAAMRTGWELATKRLTMP